MSEPSQRHPAPPPEEIEAKRGGATQAAAGPDAHFGPLRLARYVKDDGRALILYSRAPDSRDPDSGDPDSGEPYRGEPYRGEPYRGEPYRGEPYRGEPNHGELA